MKYSSFWPFLLSAALVFAACKDNKSNPSSEPTASEKGSAKHDTSTDDTSTDDTATDDTSTDEEAGLRAAALDDLPKNMELKLFDQTVYLSTGSKQGLFALRIPDELWIITYSDFAGGELLFKEGSVGKQNVDTDAAKMIVGHLTEGIKLSFKVDKEDKLRYAVNGAHDYSEAFKASVAVQKGKVSKADVLKNKIYTCAAGEETQVFTFFDDAYIFENFADEKVTFWQAGHYDIQRSTLLMLPAYFGASADSMYTYAVGEDDSITAGGVKMDCTVEESEYEYETASDFVGDWVAIKNSINWKFSLKAEGTFELSAHDGENLVDSMSGNWEVYGYHLMLRNNNCLHPDSCFPGIHGQLQAGPIDRETGKISGFSFIHSARNATPAIPTSFEAAEYTK